MSPHSTENNFEGPIASSYELINLISPNTIPIAKRIGEIVSSLLPQEEIAGFEIGCGTGICTFQLLNKRDKIKITAIDSSSDMLEQARKKLGDEIKKGRLSIVETDALTALKKHLVQTSTLSLQILQYIISIKTTVSRYWLKFSEF